MGRGNSWGLTNHVKIKMMEWEKPRMYHNFNDFAHEFGLRKSSNHKSISAEDIMWQTARNTDAQLQNRHLGLHLEYISRFKRDGKEVKAGPLGVFPADIPANVPAKGCASAEDVPAKVLMNVDGVNHPAHYEDVFRYRKCECIDVVEVLPFCLGCCIKYIWRAGCKGGKEQALEDIRKARWYLDRYERHYESREDENRRNMAAGVASAIDSESDKAMAIKAVLEGHFTSATLFLAKMEEQFEAKEEHNA